MCSGNGNNSDNLVYISIGTGVGGAIIANGQLVEGYNFSAGELGYLVDLDDFDSKTINNLEEFGCLERKISGHTLTQRVAFTFMTNKTKFGRYVYAVGGNKQAAKLSGINTKRVNFFIFVLMGLLTALTSIVFTGRLNAATSSAGNLFELDAIAACYIGGTSTSGGIGTMYGAIIGALVMASLDNGMSLMNVEIMYQYIIKGAILLFAVWIDFVTKKKA